MSNREWAEAYGKSHGRYQKLTRQVRSLLEELFERDGIKATFESRTKTIASFEGKIARPGKAYGDPLSELTDLSGVRIILYSLSDVEKVRDLITREFRVDVTRSVNKSDQLAPDQFGYVSQHLIINISDSRRTLPEWADVSDLCAEVQVRTVLQHAWAGVAHFLVYKSEIDAPRRLRRRFSRLSALFELADEELDWLIAERHKETVSYETSLDRGEKSVEINIDSLRVFISSASEPQYWAHYIRDKIRVTIQPNHWGDLSRDVAFAELFGLKSIADVDDLLKAAHGWGEIFLSNYFQECFATHRLSSPDRVNVVINGPISMLMLATNAERITAEIMAREFGWGGGETLLTNALRARGLTSKD